MRSIIIVHVSPIVETNQLKKNRKHLVVFLTRALVSLNVTAGELDLVHWVSSLNTLTLICHKKTVYTRKCLATSHVPISLIIVMFLHLSFILILRVAERERKGERKWSLSLFIFRCFSQTFPAPRFTHGRWKQMKPKRLHFSCVSIVSSLCPDHSLRKASVSSVEVEVLHEMNVIAWTSCWLRWDRQISSIKLCYPIV